MQVNKKMAPSLIWGMLIVGHTVRSETVTISSDQKEVGENKFRNYEGDGDFISMGIMINLVLCVY